MNELALFAGAGSVKTQKSPAKSQLVGIHSTASDELISRMWEGCGRDHIKFFHEIIKAVDRKIKESPATGKRKLP